MPATAWMAGDFFIERPDITPVLLHTVPLAAGVHAIARFGACRVGPHWARGRFTWCRLVWRGSFARDLRRSFCRTGRTGLWVTRCTMSGSSSVCYSCLLW